MYWNSTGVDSGLSSVRQILGYYCLTLGYPRSVANDGGVVLLIGGVLFWGFVLRWVGAGYAGGGVWA
jgi:hypothetical protein